MILAGTGHRPKYLPCKYKEPHPWLDKLQATIIAELAQLNPIKVISGGAIGFDTWLAETALLLDIPVEVYLPFKDSGNTWPNKSRERLQKLKEDCEVKYCAEHYNRGVFHHRDKLMVDDADQVIALYNPEVKIGGTFFTVNYAVQNNKPLVNLWDKIIL